MKNIRRNENSSSPVDLKPGDIEYEMGVPFPGKILERDQWAQSALKQLPQTGALDLPALFGREAPMAVEIGCGNGRFTISSAIRRPDWDHLAIDLLPAVIRYATRRANQRGLSNVRVAVCDGWRFLQQLLPPCSAHEIHIYHPQPYADPVHASKRMLTPDFLRLLYQALVPGGKIFLQSDNKPYWDYISGVMTSIFGWQERTAPWSEDPNGRSRREMLSIAKGLTVYRGIATRAAEYSNDDLERLTQELPLPSFKLDSKKKLSYRRKSRGPKRGSK
jgi:tRNA (guanine-N7-)-methyltransferase